VCTPDPLALDFFPATPVVGYDRRAARFPPVWVHVPLLQRWRALQLAMPQTSVTGLVDSLVHVHEEIAHPGPPTISQWQLLSPMQAALRAYFKVRTAVTETINSLAHPPTQPGHAMRACPVCAHGALDLVRNLKSDLGRTSCKEVRLLLAAGALDA